MNVISSHPRFTVRMEGLYKEQLSRQNASLILHVNPFTLAPRDLLFKTATFSVHFPFIYLAKLIPLAHLRKTYNHVAPCPLPLGSHLLCPPWRPPKDFLWQHSLDSPGRTSATLVLSSRRLERYLCSTTMHGVCVRLLRAGD